MFNKLEVSIGVAGVDSDIFNNTMQTDSRVDGYVGRFFDWFCCERDVLRRSATTGIYTPADTPSLPAPLPI